MGFSRNLTPPQGNSRNCSFWPLFDWNICIHLCSYYALIMTTGLKKCLLCLSNLLQINYFKIFSFFFFLHFLIILGLSREKQNNWWQLNVAFWWHLEATVGSAHWWRRVWQKWSRWLFACCSQLGAMNSRLFWQAADGFQYNVNILII